jgi:hypothetical protein
MIITGTHSATDKWIERPGLLKTLAHPMGWVGGESCRAAARPRPPHKAKFKKHRFCRHDDIKGFYVIYVSL